MPEVGHGSGWNQNRLRNCSQCELWRHMLCRRETKFHQAEQFQGVDDGEDIVECDAEEVRLIKKVKRAAQGQIEKIKARLYVREFEQEQGIDFEEVLPPVMRHNSLCALIAIAAVNDLEDKQLDVRTAFLHEYLEEDVYIYAPSKWIRV